MRITTLIAAIMIASPIAEGRLASSTVLAAQAPATQAPAAQAPAAQAPATQVPAGQSAAPSTAPQGSPTAPTPAPPENYTYSADSRRDPFTSLLGTGDVPSLASRRSDGVSGMLTAEISVRGVMKSGASMVALVQGPDNRTYLVKTGDKLMDGSVRSVTQQGLVIVQTVNDPLSLEKTREVRRLLRSAEDARQ